MEEIRLRPLNNGDLFEVARMLGKITRPARLQIMVAVRKAKEDPKNVGMQDYVDIMLTILQTLLVDANSDIEAWFASLAGMERDAYHKLPPITSIQVCKQLAKSEDMKDFLSEVASLVSGSEVLQEIATSSPSDTAGQTK
jgi:hypothetical protein